jgi:hypothetical protein
MVLAFLLEDQSPVSPCCINIYAVANVNKLITCSKWNKSIMFQDLPSYVSIEHQLCFSSSSSSSFYGF